MLFIIMLIGLGIMIFGSEAGGCLKFFLVIFALGFVFIFVPYLGFPILGFSIIFTKIINNINGD